MLQYYIIESTNYDHIDRIWFWCQYSGRDLPMYRTRITQSLIAWVVECPTDRTQTAFLLNFAKWVSPINPPLYANSGAFAV